MYCLRGGTVAAMRATMQGARRSFRRLATLDDSQCSESLRVRQFAAMIPQPSRAPAEAIVPSSALR
jgi:hypothetical protein